MASRGSYFYDDPEKRPPARHGFKLGDPNPKYCQHYANYLELRFIESRTQGADKWQATKELSLCEKKLEWWSKRPGFSLEVCLPEIQKLKRQWEVSNIPDRWSS